MNGPSPSQLRDEFLDGDFGLFKDALERAGFERLMLGNYDRDALFPQNQVRTALPDGKKSQTLQGPCGLRPVDIARQFHATARMGSSTKCRRTCRGCSPGSKYPFTTLATIACSSARVSPLGGDSPSLGIIPSGDKTTRLRAGVDAESNFAHRGTVPAIRN